MKYIKRVLLIIFTPVLIIALVFGITYISNEWRIQRNICNTEKQNAIFYSDLNNEGINYLNYYLYEEVFIEDGVYYLIFTEDSTAIHEEGEIIQGIMISIETDIYSEYKSEINLGKEDANYVLPYLWLAGGGSAYGTSQAFYKRAELRRLIVENNTKITQQNITIKIEGSHCLGKLEFNR